MVNVRKQTACAYIPLRQGFWYLAAVMDRHSRYVLAWRLSNTLEGIFCLEALDEAPSAKQPEILNGDQGSQFTAAAFTSRLTAQITSRERYHRTGLVRHQPRPDQGPWSNLR